MAKAAPIFPLAVTGKPLGESAPVLLVRWNEIIAWSSTIHDPGNVSDLHNMRIAAKRLRYTLEIFAPVLVDADSVLTVVEEIQERIGRIHDCDVLFPLLLESLEREMKREGKGPTLRRVGPPPFLAAEGFAALIGSKRADRHALYEEFLLWWDALPPERIGSALERIVAQACASVGAASTAPTPEELTND